MKLNVEIEDEPNLGINPLDEAESVESDTEFDPEFDDPPAPA